jgi:large subunit ribosomal protein L4
MPQINVVDVTGKKVGKLDLKDEVFGAEYNEALIHQVVVAQAANKRQGTKSTLTRTEVRGGGVKPWRQKGTGRARQGSIRSPQWIKGGVVFAPKPRDFSKKINKKAKDAAMKSALSYKAQHNEIIVLDDIKLTAPKTREVAAILKNLALTQKTLLVVPDGYEGVVIASANIPFVTTTASNSVSVHQLVNNINMLTTKTAIKQIEEALI